MDTPRTKTPAPAPGKLATTWRIPKKTNAQDSMLPGTTHPPARTTTTQPTSDTSRKRKSPSELFLELGLDLPDLDLLSPLHSPVSAPPPPSNGLPPAIQTPPFSPPPIPEHTATPLTAESPTTPGPSVAAPLESEPLPLYATTD
nr:PREDICTED: pollen-specific leucine-rich repeat extensin-like protein 1 [Bemisia tabaci]